MLRLSRSRHLDPLASLWALRSLPCLRGPAQPTQVPYLPRPHRALPTVKADGLKPRNFSRRFFNLHSNRFSIYFPPVEILCRSACLLLPHSRKCMLALALSFESAQFLLATSEQSASCISCFLFFPQASLHCCGLLVSSPKLCLSPG